MTVKELRLALELHPDDAEVVVRVPIGAVVEADTLRILHQPSEITATAYDNMTQQVRLYREDEPVVV